MKAERDKRATILQAEGLKQSEIARAEAEKQAKILRAEAEKEADIRHAEGLKESQLLEAEGKARAIEEVSTILAGYFNSSFSSAARILLVTTISIIIAQLKPVKKLKGNLDLGLFVAL